MHGKDGKEVYMAIIRNYALAGENIHQAVVVVKHVSAPLHTCRTGHRRMIREQVGNKVHEHRQAAGRG